MHYYGGLSAFSLILMSDNTLDPQDVSGTGGDIITLV